MYVDIELTMDMGEGVAVPVSAVLPTGKHNIVFVDKGEGKLEPRFIELGRKYGDFYEVKSGLNETALSNICFASSTRPWRSKASPKPL